MTRSPGFQPVTPSPRASISPANSPPARAGLAAGPPRAWAPRISSPRFVPAARTATTTWPGPAVGAAVSRSSNTAPSGPGTENHAFIVCVIVGLLVAADSVNEVRTRSIGGERTREALSCIPHSSRACRPRHRRFDGKGDEHMALQVRRVITGHDANGKAKVLIDEVSKNVS